MRVLAWPAFKPEAAGNPYTGLLYRAVEDRGVSVDEFSPGRLLRNRYDVCHVHWPEWLAHHRAAVVRVCVFAALVVWARARGTRVVWTVHNLDGHAGRNPRLERRFMRWFARHVDGAVFLSEGGARLARERHPALAHARTAVVSHGHYADAYPNGIRRVEARALLGLAASDRVLASVGRIAPYKNVAALVDTFRRLEDRDARLVVAGRPASREIGLKIEEAAADDERVLLWLDEVADSELQVFLNAADCLVLPYERVLNSGSALLALSFGRPVLAPAGAAMTDLRTQVGAEAVRLYTGRLSPADLAAALAAPAPAPAELAARVREAHDWSRIAEATVGLYRAVAGAPAKEAAVRRRPEILEDAA